MAFALTETWLIDHNPAELHIPGHSLYRQDQARPRSKRGRDSGRVALYIRDDQTIFGEVVFTYSNGVIEAIGLQLKSLNLLLVVLYRQPDNQECNRRSTSREFGHFLGELEEFLASQSPPAPDIVVMGDFNLPHSDWSGGESTQGATGDESDMVRASNELTSSHFLVQQVVCSTHKDGGMLDLIFTNNGDLIHNFSVLPSPKSDRFLIEISAVYKDPSASEVEHSSMADAVDGEDPDFGDLNFFSEKIDSNALKMELDRCMGCFDFRGLSSSFMMDRFLSTCLSVAREFVPLRKILPKHNYNVPKDRRILLRRRRKIIQQRAVATGEAWRDALNCCLAEIEKSLQ